MFFVNLLALTVIAIVAYFTVMKIIDSFLSQKRKRLSSFLGAKSDRKQQYLISNKYKGILEYLNPSFVISEAKKYGVTITKSSFVMTFLTGTLVGVIVMIVYFQPIIFLLPLSVIGGVIATNIRLHNVKKKYIQDLDAKLAIYMSTLSTAISSFSNLQSALKSIIPTLEFPVKGEVEEALLILQDGKDVKEAFRKMSEKYPQKQVKLFHDQLDVFVKSGSGNAENLRTIARKMKRKEVHRRKLQTAHRAQFKVWRALVFLSLSAPFLFIFVSMDNYKLVMNHIASSVVFGLTFFYIFFTYRQLEKLEMYDPTSDESINL
ncbi:type II secretion system F family protein [Bacillus safensis]|uniref:type II secretion system F family protein n=1 Tax=Bacillus safensis TaxID=561879 RepID=UPI003672916A